MKSTISIILLFTVFSGISQSFMDKQTEILYYLKISNRDYRHIDFYKSWLKSFDINYENYYKNEFELNEKIQNLKTEIEVLKSNISFDKLWIGTKMNAEFGEYNFNTNQFEFHPFTFIAVRTNESRSYNINESNYFFNNARIPEARSSSTEIAVINHADFIGLPINADLAKNLMNKRTTTNNYGTKINRKVFLKFYYSMVNKNNVFTDWTKKQIDQGLYCYIYKIEIWDDECMKENKIAELFSKSQPPYYLVSTKEDLNNIIQKKNPKNLTLDKEWFKLVDSKITNLKGNNCDNEKRYEIHCNFEKIQSDLYNINFKFRTDACLNFSNGYIYTITDYNGAEYPLLVHNVSKNDAESYIIAAVKINKKTLQKISNHGISYIKFEFGSTKDNVHAENSKSYLSKADCKPIEYTSVKWNSIKKINPEYWMCENANIEFRSFAKTILNN